MTWRDEIDLDEEVSEQSMRSRGYSQDSTRYSPVQRDRSLSPPRRRWSSRSPSPLSSHSRTPASFDSGGRTPGTSTSGNRDRYYSRDTHETYGDAETVSDLDFDLGPANSSDSDDEAEAHLRTGYPILQGDELVSSEFALRGQHLFPTRNTYNMSRRRAIPSVLGTLFIPLILAIAVFATPTQLEHTPHGKTSFWLFGAMVPFYTILTFASLQSRVNMFWRPAPFQLQVLWWIPTPILIVGALLAGALSSSGEASFLVIGLASLSSIAWAHSFTFLWVHLAGKRKSAYVRHTISAQIDVKGVDFLGYQRQARQWSERYESILLRNSVGGKPSSWDSEDGSQYDKDSRDGKGGKDYGSDRRGDTTPRLIRWDDGSDRDDSRSGHSRSDDKRRSYHRRADSYSDDGYDYRDRGRSRRDSWSYDEDDGGHSSRSRGRGDRRDSYRSRDHSDEDPSPSRQDRSRGSSSGPRGDDGGPGRQSVVSFHEDVVDRPSSNPVKPKMVYKDSVANIRPDEVDGYRRLPAINMLFTKILRRIPLSSRLQQQAALVLLFVSPTLSFNWSQLYSEWFFTFADDELWQFIYFAMLLISYGIGHQIVNIFEWVARRRWAHCRGLEMMSHITHYALELDMLILYRALFTDVTSWFVFLLVELMEETINLATTLYPVFVSAERRHNPWLNRFFPRLFPRTDSSDWPGTLSQAEKKGYRQRVCTELFLKDIAHFLSWAAYLCVGAVLRFGSNGDRVEIYSKDKIDGDSYNLLLTFAMVMLIMEITGAVIVRVCVYIKWRMHLDYTASVVLGRRTQLWKALILNSATTIIGVNLAFIKVVFDRPW